MNRIVCLSFLFVLVAACSPRATRFEAPERVEPTEKPAKRNGVVVKDVPDPEEVSDLNTNKRPKAIPVTIQKTEFVEVSTLPLHLVDKELAKLEQLCVGMTGKIDDPNPPPNGFPLASSLHGGLSDRAFQGQDKTGPFVLSDCTLGDGDEGNGYGYEALEMFRKSGDRWQRVWQTPIWNHQYRCARITQGEHLANFVAFDVDGDGVVDPVYSWFDGRDRTQRLKMELSTGQKVVVSSDVFPVSETICDASKEEIEFFCKQAMSKPTARIESKTGVVSTGGLDDPAIVDGLSTDVLLYSVDYFDNGKNCAFSTN